MKEKLFIHISDIHYKTNWEEQHGLVFNSFFDDLKKQLKEFDKVDKYIIISGDIVQSGDDIDAYNQFINLFDSKLSNLGINKNFRICVPGNHDLSTKHISSKKADHEGIISQYLSETDFNDYCNNPSDVFKLKLNNYKAFESEFANFGLSLKSFSGSGWDLSDAIGLYCINSSFLSIGGLKHAKANMADQGRLSINTRDIQIWMQESKSKLKIFVLHHPLDWLTEWSRRELEIILKNSYCLLLSGHAHDQSFFHHISEDNQLIRLSAPPLFTDKSDKLGYSIIKISDDTIIDKIIYRQWSKGYNFVSGVDFSSSDDGTLNIKQIGNIKSSYTHSIEITNAIISKYLKNQFEESLSLYSTQTPVWVTPSLSNVSELDEKKSDSKKITPEDIIANPRSLIINAPPQFGLTCLGRYLSKIAWELNEGKLWLFLDSRSLKPSEANIKRKVRKELDIIGFEGEDISCIILDSWNSGDKGSKRLLDTLANTYKEIPVIVLNTIANFSLFNSGNQYERSFESLYLMSLSRENIRCVVNGYNNCTHIGDEDAVTSRIVSDLETLNIHRTPLNCITILKASEIKFEESPVNRTEILSRVLYILFNTEVLPTYKIQPDMKDCEFVLGYFCETLLRSDSYFFTKKQFIQTINNFCQKRKMSLDIDMIFEILFNNHIFVIFEGNFCFRFSYWIHYFLALRMHQDKDFALFIFDKKIYVNFPEVIEFYTGIDRRRDDALVVLMEDLNSTRDAVKTKCNLPESFDPYQYIEWKPSPEALKQMEVEIVDNVSSSNLPNSIKDRYADKYYDAQKPYDQEIKNILHSDTLHNMMMTMTAASKALRNSDYSDPNLKEDILKSITGGMIQVGHILQVLLPLLADKGFASFDDIKFIAVGDFGKTREERIRAMLIEIPSNIIGWYEDDLFSQKIGPLLIDHLLAEKNYTRAHYIILLIAKKRPLNWKKVLQDYITKVDKNSFYIYDLMRTLHYEYRFSFATDKNIKDMGYLMKMINAKHIKGTKSPGKKTISKIPDSSLPMREIDI
ncbi:MAG: metallophosphoesterase [Spirochaetaceae bacterium]